MVAPATHIRQAPELKHKVADLVDTLTPNAPLDEHSKEALAKGLFDNLPSADLKSLMRTLSEKMPEHDRQETAQQTVDQLPSINQAAIVTKTFKKLPGSQQEPVANTIAIDRPDGKTTALVWRIIVGSFAIVFLLAVVGLLVHMFVFRDADPAKAFIKPELILAIITSATGFLAGLIAPSPLAKRS